MMMRKKLSTVFAALLIVACGESDPTGNNPPPPPPPPPPPAAPPGDVGFSIIDNAFVDSQGNQNAAASETMTVNQMVGWINNGANLHTVTFTSVPSGAVTNDSGNLTGTQTFEQTLVTPGVYLFRCDVHPATMFDAKITVS